MLTNFPSAFVLSKYRIRVPIARAPLGDAGWNQKPMPRFKQIGLLVIVALVAGAGYAGWQHFSADGANAQEPGPQRGGGGPVIETARVAFAEIETLIEAVGTTRANRAIQITPTAAGRITEINFHAGESVQAGDVLLRLDDDIQRADLIEAEARLGEAKRALERAQALMKSSATSRASVEKLVADMATAQANRDRATRRLRDRIVTAPFDGIVGFARVEIGERIEEGDAITTLDDLSVVEIEFSIPESLYGRIAPGKRVIADASAFPDRVFEGTIERIDSRIDPVSRAFKARAIIANPDNILPSGMFMHLSVVLDSRNALTVPEEAIVVEGSQAYVFAVTPADKGLVAQRRDIVIGQRSFGSVEILEGVEEGDAVIIRGVQKARDGRPVRRAGPADGRNAPGPTEAAG